MDDDALCCCVFLICMVSSAAGVPCLYYGSKCKNAELRDEHRNRCKNIHTDDSAVVLQVFGWIFFLPWFLVLIAYAWKIHSRGRVEIHISEVWHSPAKGLLHVDYINRKILFITTCKTFQNSDTSLAASMDPFKNSLKWWKVILE